MLSGSRILDDDDIHSQILFELNNAAFLDSASSDDESAVSHEDRRLDEIPECGDFANWYSHESFSQPVQSSPTLKEPQLITNELITSATSPSIRISRSISDGACMERKRRKRTKDEINAEKVTFHNFNYNHVFWLFLIIMNSITVV